MQRLELITLAPAAAVANNIALAQALGGAGNLVLNGAAVAGGVATLDIPRRVYLHSVADDHLRKWTVTGTDRQGRALVETLAAAGAGLDAVTLNDFATVTQIALDGATAGNVTVGTGGIVSSQWFPVDRYSMMNLGIACTVSGVANYTIEIAYDDPFTAGVGVLPNAGVPTPVLVPFPHPTLVAQAAAKDGSIGYGITAVRLTLNSFTAPGSVTARFVPGFAGDEG